MEIGKQLLAETAAYAESSMCRRRHLLHYFGENYDKDNCENCDNCLNPKKQVEAKDLLCAVIETIIATKEKFKAEMIIDILSGNESDDIKTYNFTELESFNSISNEEKQLLPAVIRQALINKYIDKEIENYGVLKVTAAGKKFLNNPVSFKVSKDNDFAEEVEATPQLSGGAGAVDPVLFSMLKDLRKQIAKQNDIPPYVIFQDQSLEAMATTYPINIDELTNIPGVGVGKASKFGADFVALIRRHVEENDIERPEDLRVRTIANKSKLKISIIQAIDRKVALDDLAESKGIEFGELLDEIEAIVNSGTKVNIDYFLEEVMDEDTVNDIFDYFRNSQTEDLSTAIKDLEDSDYLEEEIRLVRIKFISDLGN